MLKQFCAVLGAWTVCLSGCAALPGATAGGDGSATGGPGVTAFVLETGGPVTPAELDLIVTEVRHALEPTDGAVRVLVVDGPNSDVSTMLALPGLTSIGELETESGNRVARGRDLAELADAHREALSAAFTTTASLDLGRDLLGGVERMAVGGAERVVLWSTSGGVHRTAEADFLEEIPAPKPLEVAEASIEFRGIGDVPVAAGAVPSRDFTQSLLSYWSRLCDQLANDCHVVS